MVRSSKIAQKESAISLRKRGLSYSEILNVIPVSKSTLSSWLSSVELSKVYRERLSKKRLRAAQKGAMAKKEIRSKTIAEIKAVSREDIRDLSRKELWLMGVILYWASGLREKRDRPSLGVRFASSDPYLIRLFLKWLKDIGGIEKESITFDLFINEDRKSSVGQMVNYWSRITSFPPSSFSHIYFQKAKPRIKTATNNSSSSYFGLLRIRVRASSMLSRQVEGWIEGINKYFWRGL